MIILGTDEAGYGPNLGPLVVSLTVWKADAEDLSLLFEPLSQAGISVGDSKKLYQGGSLAALETGVLVPLRFLERDAAPSPPVERAGTREEGIVKTQAALTPALIPALTPALSQRERGRGGERGRERERGREGERGKERKKEREQRIDCLVPQFAEILRQYRVRLLDMQSRSIEPEEFNRLLDRFGSKGSLLSDVTLRLIADELATHAQDHVLVLCDKHGGRNRYLDLLTEFFAGEFIQVIQESRESSIYRVVSEDRRWEFRFVAKGEVHLPIALASMLSKYYRELAMLRFNAFWQDQVPGLQPTAGYPEDAKRFKRQIAAAQERLGIADENLWRKR